MKPISRTAFYCTGVRMMDAEQPHPVCGDQYARRFMTPEALQLFEPFRDQTYPNSSNVARHRIIDDLLRVRLARNPDQRVVIIGAGFDSRAFRLTGGRWVELDEPQVLAFKEERLPAAGAPNPLQRIDIDFATQTLEERLAPFRGESAGVVLEGVSMYLAREQITNLIRALRSTFPSHTLLVDLMTRTFFRRYGREMQERLRELGAAMVPSEERPEVPFLEGGYRLMQRISIPGRAAELGAIRLPRILQWTLFRSLVKGYQIHVFETGTGET